MWGRPVACLPGSTNPTDVWNSDGASPTVQYSSDGWSNFLAPSSTEAFWKLQVRVSGRQSFVIFCLDHFDNCHATDRTPSINFRTHIITHNYDIIIQLCTTFPVHVPCSEAGTASADSNAAASADAPTRSADLSDGSDGLSKQLPARLPTAANFPGFEHGFEHTFQFELPAATEPAIPAASAATAAAAGLYVPIISPANGFPIPAISAASIPAANVSATAIPAAAVSAASTATVRATNIFAATVHADATATATAVSASTAAAAAAAGLHATATQAAADSIRFDHAQFPSNIIYGWNGMKWICPKWSRNRTIPEGKSNSRSGLFIVGVWLHALSCRTMRTAFWAECGGQLHQKRVFKQAWTLGLCFARMYWCGRDARAHLSFAEDSHPDFQGLKTTGVDPSQFSLQNCELLSFCMCRFQLYIHLEMQGHSFPGAMRMIGGSFGSCLT